MFSIYIDELINKVKGSGYGCKIHNDYFGCLVYADDVILISHSVTTMQHMLDICDLSAAELDMKFNTIKSVAMRIGKRYNIECSALTLSGKTLFYVKSLKYLGVHINAAVNFKCTYDHVKQKFYKIFNAIYSKSKASNSELVTVELFRSYCLPSMLYAVEASFPKK